MTIKKKLVLTFFVLLIVPIFCLQIWSYHVMTGILEENVCQAECHALNSAVKSTQSVFVEMNRILVWLSRDNEVRELIENELIIEEKNDSKLRYQQFHDSEKILDRSQLLLMKYPFDILLVPKKGIAYGNCEKTQIRAEAIRASSWYSQVVTSTDNKIRWMESASELPDGEEFSFFASLPIHSVSRPSEIAGIAYISVSEELICETLQQANPYGEAYLINADAMIVSASDKKLLHTQVATLTEEKVLPFARNREMDWARVRINGQMNYALFSEWLTENWGIITFIPDTYILGQFRTTRLSMLLISLLIVFLALVAAVLLAGVISRPIVRLSNIARKVEKGDLAVRTPEESDGEIGVLERNFNRMMSRMVGMMEELRLKEHKKRQAEINALQAQINPHFLFNTLSSIRWASNNERVEGMVLSLCTLLKACMSRGGNIITLGEECELLAQYVELNNLRHAGKVEFHDLLPKEMHGLRLPRFLLQPLVENSIIHGFENRDGFGNIWLSGVQDESGVMICIQDDGCGFPDHFIITEPPRRDHRNGASLSSIALKNVQERLILNYGECAWIRCTNDLGADKNVLGAQVQIFFPKGIIPEEEQIIVQ